MSVVDGADNLVQFEMNGAGIAILRVLNKEDHQEGHDRGRSVDHELPSVGEMEVRARDGPSRDQEQGC